MSGGVLVTASAAAAFFAVPSVASIVPVFVGLSIAGTGVLIITLSRYAAEMTIRTSAGLSFILFLLKKHSFHFFFLISFQILQFAQWKQEHK
jgi:hypothetical protein